MSTKLDKLMAGVVERLIATIGEVGDWSKPWKALATGAHRQVENDRPYTGINAIILWIEELARGLADPRWGTYKTWQRVGAQVRSGERGTQLIFWKMLYACGTCDVRFGEDRDDAYSHQGSAHGGEYGHVEGTPILRWFTVFNADQCDGVPAALEVEVTPLELQMAQARAFIEATGCVVDNHPARAFFRHDRPDRIYVPQPGQFDSEPAYWGTVFHEVTHWTGHESRLDRQSRNRFGDAAYAGEELVAELGAAFLAAHLGVETEPHPNHAAYLKSWLAAISEEPTRLYHASKDATEAVRYLIEASGTQAEAA